MDLSKKERIRILSHLLCEDDSSLLDEGMYEASNFIRYNIRGILQLEWRASNNKAESSELKQQVHEALVKRLNEHGSLLQAYHDMAMVLGQDIRRDPDCGLLPHRDDLVAMMVEYDIPLYMIDHATMLNAHDYPPNDLEPLGVIDSPKNTDKSMEHGDYAYHIEERLADMERFDLLVYIEAYQKYVPNAPTLPEHLLNWWKHL